MRYAIVLNGDLTAPHLKIYTNILDDKKIPYDVISWDRSNSLKKSEFTYSEPSAYMVSSYQRLWSYIKFARFIKHIMRKKRYDKLVVISPQVALFISFFLKNNYKGKYIFDYRDLSIEQKAPFKPLLRIVLKNSYANVISSPGFKEYLPKGFNYVLSHNFNIRTVRSALQTKALSLPEGNLKLLTIGGIRFDANREVIESLGNLDGIELSFVGKGGAAPILEHEVKEKGFTNISFKGQYNKEDEGGIIIKHSMINIFYPNKPSHISALSNRFYNSLIYKRPMLVTKGGIQGYFVDKYSVGLSVENCDGLGERLKGYIENLDFTEYEQRCNALLREFVRDYESFLAVIECFVDSGKNK